MHPMKTCKILFVDGIDGAGKTTVIQLLKARIKEKTKWHCQIINQDFLEETRVLYKIDERLGIQSSKLSKLSYRFARLSIALNVLLSGPEGIHIFDRGLVHFITKSRIEGVSERLIEAFVKDLVKGLKATEFSTAFLYPPLAVAAERLEKRKNPSKLDQDKDYLAQYYQLSKAAFSAHPHPGRYLEIDSSKVSPDQSADLLFEFLAIEGR